MAALDYIKAARRSVVRLRVSVRCHPEQADVAQRRIWAICAMRRVLCDAIIARLDRFRSKLDHYRRLTLPDAT